MNKILVVDKNLIAVWVYPDKGIIHQQVKAYCYGDEFREGLTRGLEAMKQYGATKWLSDNRATGPLPPEDEAWADTVWFPQAKIAGWQRWAIVKPTKILGQLNLERISKIYAERGIDARLFGDPDEAMLWLRES